MQAAARLHDAIAHSSAMKGLVGFAVIGASLALGAALILATGGEAAPLLIGATLAGGATGAWIGEYIGSLSYFREKRGEIAGGSPDVLVNNKPLARALEDRAECGDHEAKRPQIATGSGSVFINGKRAARVEDKLVCGGIIVEGSPDVFIGGGVEEEAGVEDEVPWPVHGLVMGAGVVGALLLGGWAIVPGLVGGFGMGMAGGAVMGEVGSRYGGWLSEKIGGRASDWEKTGEFAGQAIGGWLGAKAGPKAWGVAKRVKVDTNTLGANGGNFRIAPRLRPLETTSLHNIYLGEEIPDNPNSWTQGNGTVIYFSDEERASYKLTIKDGRLYDAKGNLFDTFDAMTWDGRNKAIYVMDEDGNLYVHKRQKIYEIHHSSLNRGKPVAGAGEIYVRNGVLQYMDNRSGHYLPSEGLLKQTINELRDQGLDLSNASISTFGR